MEAPTVKKVKVFATVESVLEAKASPQELNDYLRANRFTGSVDYTYDAIYCEGGLRRLVTKEHIPITMAELDRILAARNNP
jgi:hypothetical protein